MPAAKALRHQDLDCPPQQLLPAVAEHALRLPIDEDDAAFLVGDDHRVGGVLNERRKIALGRAFRHTPCHPLPTTKTTGRADAPTRSFETAYYTAARPKCGVGRVKTAGRMWPGPPRPGRRGPGS